MRQVTFIRFFMLLLLPALSLGATASASLLEGKQLTAALAGGGYVCLMLPANSSDTPPTADRIEPGNVGHERQLDQRGYADAKAMGEAFRRLRISVDRVLSSTAYRALQTARLAQFPDAHTYDDLTEAGVGPEETDSLRAQVAVAPAAGSDTVIITHFRNISAAFPSDAKDLAEGDTLVYRPDGKGSAVLVARVKIEAWPKLAAAQ